MQFNSGLNFFKIFLFCMIGLTVFSCKSYYTTLTIQTAPKPAKDELPEEVQSLTLMNRSLNNQFLVHNDDSLQAYFFRHNYELSAVVLDSMVADTTIKAMAALLFESGRYDVVVPVERNLPRTLSYNLIPDTLSSQEVSQLCRQYNTDALMVMEKFSTKVMTDNSVEKYMDRYAGVTYLYYASLDLKYDVLFRIYKPGSKTLAIQLTDTISWESSDNDEVRMLNKLPGIRQALISAGIKIALDVSGKISPEWNTEKRGYFIFSHNGDPGQQLMNENKTQQAREYWLEKAQSSKKKIKSRAEFNLALASELDGDIDQAIEWGLKSFQTFYDYRTELYLKKLQAIKEEQQTK